MFYCITFVYVFYKSNVIVVMGKVVIYVNFKVYSNYTTEIKREPLDMLTTDQTLEILTESSLLADDWIPAVNDFSMPITAPLTEHNKVLLCFPEYDDGSETFNKTVASRLLEGYDVYVVTNDFSKLAKMYLTGIDIGNNTCSLAIKFPQQEFFKGKGDMLLKDLGAGVWKTGYVNSSATNNPLAGITSMEGLRRHFENLLTLSATATSAHDYAVVPTVLEHVDYKKVYHEYSTRDIITTQVPNPWYRVDYDAREPARWFRYIPTPSHYAAVNAEGSNANNVYGQDDPIRNSAQPAGESNGVWTVQIPWGPLQFSDPPLLGGTTHYGRDPIMILIRNNDDIEKFIQWQGVPDFADGVQGGNHSQSKLGYWYLAVKYDGETSYRILANNAFAEGNNAVSPIYSNYYTVEEEIDSPGTWVHMQNRLELYSENTVKLVDSAASVTDDVLKPTIISADDKRPLVGFGWAPFLKVSYILKTILQDVLGYSIPSLADTNNAFWKEANNYIVYHNVIDGCVDAANAAVGMQYKLFLPNATVKEFVQTALMVLQHKIYLRQSENDDIINVEFVGMNAIYLAAKASDIIEIQDYQLEVESVEILPARQTYFNFSGILSPYIENEPYPNYGESSDTFVIETIPASVVDVNELTTYNNIAIEQNRIYYHYHAGWDPIYSRLPEPYAHGVVWLNTGTSYARSGTVTSVGEYIQHELTDMPFAIAKVLKSSALFEDKYIASAWKPSRNTFKAIKDYTDFNSRYIYTIKFRDTLPVDINKFYLWRGQIARITKMTRVIGKENYYILTLQVYTEQRAELEAPYPPIY